MTRRNVAMSESPTPAGRGISPWWGLTLIPAGLLIGWLVVQLPGPKPHPPEAAVSQAGPAATAGAESPAAAAPAPLAGVTEARRPDPPQQVVDRPAQEAPPAQ